MYIIIIFYDINTILRIFFTLRTFIISNNICKYVVSIFSKINRRMNILY